MYHAGIFIAPISRKLFPPGTRALNLHLHSNLGQIRQGIPALELGILDDSYTLGQQGSKYTSLSLEDNSNEEKNKIKRRVEKKRLTGIGVAGEVAGPLDKGAALELARGDGVAADGAHNAGVGKLGLGRDDAVRDVVVDGAVLLLLDLELGAILERPLDHVRPLLRLGELALGQRRPKVAKVLDWMPGTHRGACQPSSVTHRLAL
jgi:hypothetical protein